jgi:hypothetical protein
MTIDKINRGNLLMAEIKEISRVIASVNDCTNYISTNSIDEDLFEEVKAFVRGKLQQRLDKMQAEFNEL